MKFLQSKIFLLIVAATLVAGGYYVFVSDSEDPEIVLVEVGDVTREILEVGSVKGGDRMELGFKEGGRISEINVSTGSSVPTGSTLARLDDSNLRRDLDDAKATLRLAEVQMEKLLSGASVEDIRVAETAVENARRSLENIIITAESSLGSKYEEVITAMDTARIRVRDTLNFVNDLQKDYFSGGDTTSVSVRRARDNISSARNHINNVVSELDVDDTEEMDLALPAIINELRIVFDSLETIIDAVESFLYQNKVSDSEKTSLKEFQTSVNASISQVVTLREAIQNLKVSNESSISTAEGVLRSAEEELNRVLAGPREEDIRLREAEIERSESRVALIEDRLADFVLRSPVSGQITNVHRRAGEVVSPGESIFSFMPSAPFRVEADIYEGDIGRVGVGDGVAVELVAFPGEVFEGEISSIDPAEKIIDGVVYYGIAVDVNNFPAGVKAGMTTDIGIVTERRSDVLILPQRVIRRDGERSFVVLVDGEHFREVDVETGLVGDNRMVEIVSGVSAGDEVVVD